MTINERIKKLLARKHIRQNVFAKVLNLTPSSIYLLLNNSRGLRDEEIVKTCLFLNVSSDWLLGLKPDSDDIEAALSEANVLKK